MPAGRLPLSRSRAPRAATGAPARHILLSAILALPVTAFPSGDRPAVAVGPRSRVIEDVPGRLVIELEVPPLRALPAGPGGGARIGCDGCDRDPRPGAPDLPAWGCLILSGGAEPRVTLEPLAWRDPLPVPVTAAVPHAMSPARLEYRPDADLFAAATAWRARVGETRLLRGAPVRRIEVPLAAIAPSQGAVLSPARLRLTVEFPGAAASAGPALRDRSVLAAVANPAGGSRLARPSRPAPATRAVAKRGADPDRLGERFLRIEVGDAQIETLDEDQVYLLPFADLAATSPSLRGGIRVDDLRLYAGNHGALPLEGGEAGSPAPGELREVPMEVRDANRNGTLDEGDALAFLGMGASRWRPLEGAQGPLRYEFEVDVSAYKTAYVLSWSPRGGGKALRFDPDPKAEAVPDAARPRRTSRDYLRMEREVANGGCEPSGTQMREGGAAWYWIWRGTCGKAARDTVLIGSPLHQDRLAPLPEAEDPDGSAEAAVYLGVYAYPPEPSDDFRIYAGGRRDPLTFLGGLGTEGSWYAWRGPPAIRLDSLRWGGWRQRFEGYSVSYLRRLELGDRPLWILPDGPGERAWRVEGGAGAHCLRVEDGVPSRAIRLDATGAFADRVEPGLDVRYLVYRTPARLPKGALREEGLPPEGGALRDLATADGLDPEYLIITSADLLPAALGLRDFRAAKARLRPFRTAVATVEDIYRQYGSGRPSFVAVRDFLKRAREGWGRGGPASLGHVLLLGDGHGDVRRIRYAPQGGGRADHVPPPVLGNGREGVATDDFYAWLDPGEGGFGSLMDISVGRVPARDHAEANAYLAKAREHDDPARGGDWRSRILLSADDFLQENEDGPIDALGTMHLGDAEDLARIFSGARPGLAVDRVYLHDFPMNGAGRKPEAAQALLAAVNRGTLVFHYVGHGASNQLAAEFLLHSGDVAGRMRNSGRYPLFSAFACDVGQYDVTEPGLSETMVLQAGGGAIAALGASRETFPGENAQLSHAFYRRLLPADPAGPPSTLGDALRLAKAQVSGVNSSKYVLFGEPVLALERAGLAPRLTERPDTLRALACGTLEGEVPGGTGSGRVLVRVTGGPTRRLHVHPGDNLAYPAEGRGPILFERAFEYRDHRFSTEYLLPRQVPFGDSAGRIQVFAWDAAESREGMTAAEDLHVLGTADGDCSTDPEGRGPEIRITGCAEEESGEVDLPDRVRLPLPYCLRVEARDTAGGVMSAEGPDEGTTLEIPGAMDPFHPQPEVDELERKTYRLALNTGDFRPGAYVLKVTARDGFGNLGRRQLRMDLTLDSSVTALSAYNVPNPVKRGGTAFHFNMLIPKDRGGDDGSGSGARLVYTIRIFDQTGRRVRTLEKAESGRSRWDGRDDWGKVAANGVYFYTVTGTWSQAVTDRAGFRTVHSRRNVLVLSR